MGSAPDAPMQTESGLEDIPSAQDHRSPRKRSRRVARDPFDMTHLSRQMADMQRMMTKTLKGNLMEISTTQKMQGRQLVTLTEKVEAETLMRKTEVDRLELKIMEVARGWPHASAASSSKSAVRQPPRTRGPTHSPASRTSQAPRRRGTGGKRRRMSHRNRS